MGKHMFYVIYLVLASNIAAFYLQHFIPALQARNNVDFQHVSINMIHPAN